MNAIGDEEARAALVPLLGSADRNNAPTRALSVGIKMPRDPSPGAQRAWRERLGGSGRRGGAGFVRGGGNPRGGNGGGRLLDAERLAPGLRVGWGGGRSGHCVAK